MPDTVEAAAQSESEAAGQSESDAAAQSESDAAGQSESADRNGAARSDGAALRVAVVVPCYNEEGRLEVDTFAEFVKGRPWLRFVFVNDGSADGTGAVIEAAAQRSERIRALSLERNQGKAEAVRQGILAALEDGPDLVGFLPPSAQDRSAGKNVNPLRRKRRWGGPHPI